MESQDRNGRAEIRESPRGLKACRCAVLSECLLPLSSLPASDNKAHPILSLAHGFKRDRLPTGQARIPHTSK